MSNSPYTRMNCKHHYRHCMSGFALLHTTLELLCPTHQTMVCCCLTKRAIYHYPHHPQGLDYMLNCSNHRASHPYHRVGSHSHSHRAMCPKVSHSSHRAPHPYHRAYYLGHRTPHPSHRVGSPSRRVVYCKEQKHTAQHRTQRR